jgi:hypothetical protein
MLGALGEIVGAAGVIATLGYLAHQVQANTRATRHTAERELYDGSRTILSQLAGDRELARIYRLGLSGYGGLEPDELVQFSSLLLQMTNDWQRAYLFAETGDVDARNMESNQRIRRDVASTPGYKKWFETRGHWLTDEFREVMTREMLKGSEYRVLGDTQDAGSR